MKSFEITEHAVEQFIRRWGPDLTHTEAKAQLQNLLAGSKSIGRAKAGGTVFINNEKNIRFVIKDHNVCITVLPPDTALEVRQEEISLIQEMTIQEFERHHTTEQDAGLSLLEELEEKEKSLPIKIQERKDEVSELDRQIKDLDKKRIELGKEKSVLMNKKQKLMNEIKMLEFDLPAKTG